MNRTEYIVELKKCLKDVNESDKEDALRYCAEYLDEAGEDHEQQAMEELGKPAKFAAQIKADVAIRSTDSKVEEKGKRAVHNIWAIFLGIFAMPIALPLLVAAVVLLFAFFIVIICLIIAAILVGVAGVIASIAFLLSFVVLPFGVDSLIRLGGGFLCLGIGIAVSIGMYTVLHSALAWFYQVVSNLYEKAKGARHEI